MKGFSLKLAKEGHPVETKDGRKVKILCCDAKNDYPIIALIEDTYGNEHQYSFTEYGEYVKDEESNTDLVMAEELELKPQSDKVFIEEILIEEKGESTVIPKVFSTKELARVQSGLDIDTFGMMYNGNVIERSPDKYIMESDEMKVTIAVVEREVIEDIEMVNDAEEFTKTFTDRMTSDSITINKKQFNAFLKKTYLEIASKARMKY